MANSKPVIKYHYRNDDHTQSAISYTFRYLSALSGLNFVEDHNVPDIWKDDSCKAASSAKVLISRDHDPIDKIIKKLTLSAKVGPYAENRNAPSAEPALSEIIKDFVSILSKAGLFPKGNTGATIWPASCKFGLIVSHDIDIARRSVLGGIRIWAKNALSGGIPAIFDSAVASVGLRDNPYQMVPAWLMLEKELGIKSTFFIFAGKRGHANDPKYKLEMLSKAIESIKSAGSEIALHTGIQSFAGGNIIIAKSLLEEFSGVQVRGLRPHYLSASFPEYWQSAQKAGFEYSSSLGFDDNIGFYNGLDLPFYPIVAGSGKHLDIFELPIGIMDCGLIGDNDANSEDVVNRGRTFIDRVAASGGLIVLDWHQRTFYNRDYPGWVGLFVKLMKYARNSGAFFTNFDEVVKIMKSRMGKTT